jgi:hypothetical protein
VKRLRGVRGLYVPFGLARKVGKIVVGVKGWGRVS